MFVPKTFLRLFTLSAVLVAGVVSGANALSYRFDIVFESGRLAGQTFAGRFAIDASTFTGVGQEIFNPSGNFGHRLTGLQITVDGLDFSMRDDDLFGVSGTYPQIVFEDGEFRYFDFWAGTDGTTPDPAGTGPYLILYLQNLGPIEPFALAATVPYSEVRFSADGLEEQSVGIFGTLAPAVPLPASGILLVVPLLTLAARRRRAV